MAELISGFAFFFGSCFFICARCFFDLPCFDVLFLNRGSIYLSLVQKVFSSDRWLLTLLCLLVALFLLVYQISVPHCESPFTSVDLP